MCGLIGVGSTFFGKGHLDFFEQGLIANTIRGWHGTGAMSVKQKSGEERVVKSGCDGFTYLTIKQAQELITEKDLILLAGHNRYATKGEVNNHNSHPFRNKHITLMHNGVIRNADVLKDSKSFKVDSEVAAVLIAEEGPLEALKKIKGAYAFVWYDNDTNLLNMVRNLERPLYVGLSHTKNTMVYGSEVGMLTWLAERNHLNIEAFTLLPEHELWQFNLKDPKTLEPVKTKLDVNVTWYNPTKWRGNGYAQQGMGYGYGCGYNYVGQEDDNELALPGTGAIYPDKPTLGDIRAQKSQKKEAILNSIGHKYGDMITFTIFDFVKYKKKKAYANGQLKGCLTDDPYWEVEVNGIAARQAEDWMEKATAKNKYLILEGKIIGVEEDKQDNTNYKLLIGANTITIKEYTDCTDASVLSAASKKAAVANATKEVLRAVSIKTDTPIIASHYPGRGGVLLTEREWLRSVSSGCDDCGDNIGLKDAGKVKFMDAGGVMCPPCVDKWEKIYDRQKKMH